MPGNEIRYKSLEMLLEKRATVASGLNDATAKAAFDDALVTDVFQEAWRGQYDDDTGAFQRAVKDLVTQAIDKHLDRDEQ
jgi:hypothetical protein